ncbi:speckle-type POZ protein B-like [Leptopilina heterotoma]|uniref:speckle-type POZ protein B-like n=1 Tax=Leptopilina heterotoma TaxID=63436 RepID=UPI001CA7BC7D|nr:speckle-type POZ protein B-like [Leptopilina heterotoma]
MSKDTINTIYTWEIKNFRESICSPTFTLTNDSETILKLEIEKSFHVSLYLAFLKISNNLKKNSQINMKCSIMNSDSVKVLTRRANFSIDNIDDYEYEFSDFISLSELESLMNHKKANKITIICKIKQMCDISSKVYFPENIPYFEGFKFFINNEHLSDVTLNLGEQKIRAHKVILAAASPVFSKMFKHECKENLTNEVKIDFEYETFLNILKYIYSGKVENFNSLTIECFKVADYYQIDSLKTVYLEFLQNNLEKLNNVFQVLKLADDYQLSDLKNYCIAFFVDRSKVLIQHNDLKALSESHPNLLFQLLESVIDRN